MHGGCTHSRNLKLSAGNRYTTWKIMAPHFLTRASRRRTFGEALEPENAMLSRTAIFYPVYPRSVCLFSFETSGTHWAIADEQFQRSAFPRLDFSTCSRDEFVRLRPQAYGTSLKDRKTLEDEHMLEAVEMEVQAHGESDGFSELDPINIFHSYGDRGLGLPSFARNPIWAWFEPSRQQEGGKQTGKEFWEPSSCRPNAVKRVTRVSDAWKARSAEGAGYQSHRVALGALGRADNRRKNSTFPAFGLMYIVGWVPSPVLTSGLSAPHPSDWVPLMGVPPVDRTFNAFRFWTSRGEIVCFTFHLISFLLCFFYLFPCFNTDINISKT